MALASIIIYPVSGKVKIYEDLGVRTVTQQFEGYMVKCVSDSQAASVRRHSRQNCQSAAGAENFMADHYATIQ